LRVSQHAYQAIALAKKFVNFSHRANLSKASPQLVGNGTCAGTVFF